MHFSGIDNNPLLIYAAMIDRSHEDVVTKTCQDKDVSGSKGYLRGCGVQRSIFKIPSIDDITSVLYILFENIACI
jgi:hypothetical protein